ncbi:methyltransferase domain-containing protein [Dactylosporangium vinaceum]|nr:methyltransferase domain-containing protein [Dactylosporangium vinaceum]
MAANGDEPLRLHLGCGSHRLAGWTNIDLADPAADLRVDVRNGLPFDDGIAESVYIAHLLEHVEYPREAETVLRECRRVLRDGGLLRIVVPDLHSFCTAYVQRHDGFFERFAHLWQRPPASTPLASFLHYAGAGEFPWVADRHRFGYDEETLGTLLRQAGFTSVRRSQPGQSLIGDDQLDYSWANRETAEGLPYSLIMEAEAATR